MNRKCGSSAAGPHVAGERLAGPQKLLVTSPSSASWPHNTPGSPCFLDTVEEGASWVEEGASWAGGSLFVFHGERLYSPASPYAVIPSGNTKKRLQSPSNREKETRTKEKGPREWRSPLEEVRLLGNNKNSQTAQVRNGRGRLRACLQRPLWPLSTGDPRHLGIVKKMPTEPRMRDHLTPTRMAKTEKAKQCGKEQVLARRRRKRSLCALLVGDVKSNSQYGKCGGKSSKL